MFAIAILSYNHPELTVRTVQSLYPFYKDQFTVALIHNGSEKKHVLDVQNRLVSAPFPIEHILIENNCGFSGGANAAIDHSLRHHNWLLFLTNDCQLHRLPDPPALTGFYAPKIWARKAGSMDSCGGFVDLASGKLGHCKSLDEFYQIQKNANTFKHTYIPGTAFWLHRDYWKCLNAFDISLGTYWEDVDLCLRAQHQGLKLSIDDRTEIIHSIGKTCHKKPLYTSYYYQRNRKIVCRRWLQQRLSDGTGWQQKLLCVCKMINLNFILYSHWLKTILRLTRQRDWQKLQLLLQAIQD